MTLINGRILREDLGLRLELFPELRMEINFDLEPPVNKWNLVSKKEEVSQFESNGYQLELREKREAEKLLLSFKISRDDNKEFKVRNYNFTVVLPLIDIHKIWLPNLVPDVGELASVYTWRFREFTAANRSFPYLSLVSRSGINQLAVGFINQVLETELRGQMDYRPGEYQIYLSRPSSPLVSLTRKVLEDELFISREKKYWFRVVKTYADYVDEKYGYQCRSVPEGAYEPVWCSWFAFTDDINQEVILENARLGKELGVGTILVDAGWNTPTGDWFRSDGPYGDYVPVKEKFPDLKGLVQRIRGELGLKVEFWVSLFWVGTSSRAYQKLKLAKVITDEGENINLCPRHPLTREHVARTAERVMREFALDGLWIDFMDSIPRECKAQHQHIYESMGEGFAECIKAIHQAITRVNPQAFIEFRLTHANLHNKRYANIYETSDTPHDFDLNRRLGIITRSLARGIVVKADPTIWNYGERDENVAKHMATMVMGGVPALSVDLRKIPESHRRIIRAWLNFYQENKISSSCRLHQIQCVSHFDQNFTFGLVKTPSCGECPGLITGNNISVFIM